MRQSKLKWNRMEWNGMGWDGMESGIEQNKTIHLLQTFFENHVPDVSQFIFQ